MPASHQRDDVRFLRGGHRETLLENRRFVTLLNPTSWIVATPDQVACSFMYHFSFISVFFFRMSQYSCGFTGSPGRSLLRPVPGITVDNRSLHNGARLPLQRPSAAGSRPVGGEPPDIRHDLLQLRPQDREHRLQVTGCLHRPGRVDHATRTV